MAAINADRNLLFGLLALQTGLMDQDQLVTAESLVALGDREIDGTFSHVGSGLASAELDSARMATVARTTPWGSSKVTHSKKPSADFMRTKARADPGRQSLDLRGLLRRFTDVCNAIDYAHSRGVLHRDIKPGNIIVDKHDETLVVDWGLAKPVGRVDQGGHAGERTLVPSSGSSNTETEDIERWMADEPVTAWREPWARRARR